MTRLLLLRSVLISLSVLAIGDPESEFKFQLGHLLLSSNLVFQFENLADLVILDFDTAVISAAIALAFHMGRLVLIVLSHVGVSVLNHVKL